MRAVVNVFVKRRPSTSLRARYCPGPRYAAPFGSGLPVAGSMDESVRLRAIGPLLLNFLTIGPKLDQKSNFSGVPNGRREREQKSAVFLGFFNAQRVSLYLHGVSRTRRLGWYVADRFLRWPLRRISSPMLKRVIGLVRPANPASLRVLERAGFVHEREVELEGAPMMLIVRYPASIGWPL
jgi:hypothetical protein